MAISVVTDLTTSQSTRTLTWALPSSMAVGDIVICGIATEDSAQAINTPSGTGLSFGGTTDSTASHVWASMYSATSTTAGARTVTATYVGASINQHAGFCVVLPAADGYSLAGTPNKLDVRGSGAPSGSITSSAGNVGVFVNGDWAAVNPSTRAFRGTVTDDGECFLTGHATLYFWHQTLSATSTTVGLTAPTGQTYTLMGIEVLLGGGPATINATVPLVSSSTMGVTGVQTLLPTVALASTSTLGVTPALTHPASVAMASTSTMGVTGVQTILPTVALAQTSTFGVTGSQAIASTVAFTSTSTIGVTATKTVPASVALAGTSTLAVTPAVTHLPSVAMLSTSTLGVAALVTTIYYVSSAGSDSNNGGSTATPWLTVSKVNATALRPGDTVLFRAGDTFSGTTLHLTSAGTTANPITIGTYNGGSATIANGTNNAVFVDSVGGYVFQNLNFTGTSGATAFAGFNAYASSTGTLPALTLTNCVATGWQYGIQVGGNHATDGYNGVTITGCDASSNLYGGISIFSSTAFNSTTPVYPHSNVTISNTTANLNLGDPTVTTQGTGSGINVAATTTGLIQGCTAHGNGTGNGDTTSGPVGIWVAFSNNVTVRGNVAYANGSGTSVDGDGFDIDQDSTNCLIEYNLSYGNGGAGILLYGAFADHVWANNTCRYNIMWGNGQTNSGYGDLTLGGQITGAQVYGNTCISKDGSSTFPSPLLLQYTPGMTSCAVRNNIFYGSGFGDIVYDGTGGTTTQVEMQGNLYFSPHTTTIHWGVDYTTLAAWRTASSQELVSGSNSGLMTDPKFNAPTTAPTATSPAGFAAITAQRLQGASPVFGAGLDLLSLFGINPGTQDFFGDTLGALPIGADSIGTNVATVALAQTSTLGVTPALTRVAAVVLAQSSTMGVAPLVTDLATVPLGSTSTLGVAVSGQQSATVPLASTSTLTVTGADTTSAVIALPSSSILAVTGTDTVPASVAVASTSALSVGPLVSHSVSVAVAQSSTLAVTPLVIESPTAALVQSSALSATGFQTIPSVVAIAGSSTLGVAVQGQQSATVPIVGSSTLSITPGITHTATAALAQTSTLTVAAAVTPSVTITITGSSTLTVTGRQTIPNVILMAGGSVLIVSVSPPPVLPITVTGSTASLVGVIGGTTTLVTVTGNSSALVNITQ